MNNQILWVTQNMHRCEPYLVLFLWHSVCVPDASLQMDHQVLLGKGIIINAFLMCGIPLWLYMCAAQGAIHETLRYTTQLNNALHISLYPSSPASAHVHTCTPTHFSPTSTHWHTCTPTHFSPTSTHWHTCTPTHSSHTSTHRYTYTPTPTYTQSRNSSLPPSLPVSLHLPSPKPTTTKQNPISQPVKT